MKEWMRVGCFFDSDWLAETAFIYMCLGGSLGLAE